MFKCGICQGYSLPGERAQSVTLDTRTVQAREFTPEFQPIMRTEIVREVKACGKCAATVNEAREKKAAGSLGTLADVPVRRVSYTMPERGEGFTSRALPPGEKAKGKPAPAPVPPARRRGESEGDSLIVSRGRPAR